MTISLVLSGTWTQAGNITAKVAILLSLPEIAKGKNSRNVFVVVVVVVVCFYWGEIVFLINGENVVASA
jgi:hypothetical protein